MSHHATEDLAILRSLADMQVFSPGDLWEAEEATRFLVSHDGPAYLRLDKSAAPVTTAPGEIYVPGKIRTVREGSDLTLAATGGILGEALIAAGKLAENGISSRVLSVHTIKPLDVETLALAAAETGGLITIEEHTVEGGLGSAVAEALMEEGVSPGFFHRMGLRNIFSTVVGSQNYLRRAYSLDAQAIVEVATAKLSLSPQVCRQ
jgi:transketolase